MNLPSRGWGISGGSSYDGNAAASLDIDTVHPQSACHFSFRRATVLTDTGIPEKRFRRLKAPELMGDIYSGTQYVDRMAVEEVVA